jgi:hypothetical protein
MPKWFIQLYCKEFSFIILLTLGLYPNKIIDIRKKLTIPQIILFQHRSFADAYIVNYINGPTGFVYRNILNSNPIITRFIDKFGGVPVSTNKDSGQTINIINYLNNTKNQLAIAPEDISDIPNRPTTNNKLGLFKTGAFVPLKSIQPLLINFHDNTPIWRNYNINNNIVPESMIHWIFRRLFSNISYFDIYLLDESYPSIEDTPQIYRDSIRNKMLEYVENFNF